MISCYMSNKNLFWAVVREQTDHHLYIELEDLGRNRWQAVIGTDEFTFRTKEKDFLTVMKLAIETHQERSRQDSP